MLKLKLQYFGHLMRRVDSLEKTLMLGGIGGKRRYSPWCPKELDMTEWLTHTHTHTHTHGILASFSWRFKILGIQRLLKDSRDINKHTNKSPTKSLESSKFLNILTDSLMLTALDGAHLVRELSLWRAQVCSVRNSFRPVLLWDPMVCSPLGSSVHGTL